MLIAGAALLAAAPAFCGVIGGISPHHEYAGEMIERLYSRLAEETERVGRVFIFSPDHFRRSKRWISLGGGETARALVSSCSGVDEPLFEREHGVKIHLPFIRKFFPEAEIVMLTVKPDAPDAAMLLMRDNIVEIAGPRDIFLLSMDFSHNKEPEDAAAEDRRTLEVIKSLDRNGADECDVDARRALSLYLAIIKKLGPAKAVPLDSGFSPSPDGTCTSYATVLFYSGN